MKKICYISCCHQLNYTRRIQFVEALNKAESVEQYFVLNKSKNFFRYFEIIKGLIKIRLKYNIDIFILGFRGNELFYVIWLLTLGKPLFFDAFVPFHNAFVRENKWNLPRPVLFLCGLLVYYYEYLTLKLSTKIFTDTDSHKNFFVSHFNISQQKISPIYLGCPENLSFFQKKKLLTKNKVSLFFYGTMQPLHGINILLEIAKFLDDRKEDILITIVGGDKEIILSFIKKNKLKNIIYYSWVDKQCLFQMAMESHLCLGGPLGNTPQAHRIITGKTFQFLKLGKCTIVGRNKETNLFPFKDKKNCLLVELGNANSLKLSILWASQNINELIAIGNNGKRLYNDYFETNTLEKKLLDNLIP